MGDFGINLPFELEKIDNTVVRDQQNILRQFPGSIDGISLNRLRSVLRSEEIKLHLTGIEPNPTGIPSNCVAVALVSRGRPESFRGVLGLSSELAMGIVNQTLGRERRPDDAHPFMDEQLLPGEKGALLFALDAAAGDWISMGGNRFMLKSLLYDGEQVPDYLRGGPNWAISGKLTGAGLNGHLWLWFKKPIPSTLKPVRIDVGERAWLWRSSVNLVVGCTEINTTDVDNLSLGDRVVLDGWNHPDARGGAEFATLVSGNWSRFARWLDNRNIKVIGTKGRAVEMDKTTNQDKINALLEPAQGDDEGEMSVTVTVEVGSFRTSVRQAAALVPGTVVSLDKPVGPAVVLKVQGKVIGKGVLVEQEGFMSVEVKEVLV